MSLLQKVKSLSVSMFDIDLQKLVWMYCSGHSGVKGYNYDRADRVAGKATIVNGMRLGMAEVFRSWRHYLQEQSQDTTPATAWRDSHRQSDEHWSYLKTTLGKRLTDGVERIWALPSRYHLELS